MRALELVTQLADDVVARDSHRPVGPWMWGPALQGFALGELETHLGEPRYRDWLTRYGEHYLAHPPAIHSSDTVAPGLVSYYLQRTGDDRFRPLTDRVLAYVEHQPRLVGDAVNHLGTGGYARFYPKSVWVDSIMMFGVFPARYGAAEHRPDLVDIAARQPGQLAGLLQDPASGLWQHAYWTGLGPLRRPGPYPRGLFWARGNAWVVAALPMILDAVGPAHPRAAQIRELLAATSAALRDEQRPDGAFPTLLAHPRPGYRELSATALVAAGWLHAGRAGYLDESYLGRGRRALLAVLRSLHRTAGGWAMPEISGPTIPLPVFPTLGYRLIPTGDNHPYGVAGLILAAIAADRVGW